MSFVHRAAYSVLIHTAPFTGTRPGSFLWDRAWSFASPRFRGRTTVSMHGRRVTVNVGYTYPAFSRRWRTLNAPLVELVHQAARVTGPVRMMDVGAAVGDTILLVLECCPRAIARFDCVEGDPEFFDCLQSNVADVPSVHLHHAMLSDRPGQERTLVRTHPGTASAQGGATTEATTLDLLAEQKALEVDLIKVDTDGFDGKVLAGATGLLSRDRPAIIFEWHPVLCQATGNSWWLPFEVLAGAGYDNFVWFTKYGTFSHIDRGYDQSRLGLLADMCIEGRGPCPDWHYDVVALPAGSSIDVPALIALGHASGARTRRG